MAPTLRPLDSDPFETAPPPSPGGSGFRLRPLDSDPFTKAPEVPNAFKDEPAPIAPPKPSFVLKDPYAQMKAPAPTPPDQPAKSGLSIPRIAGATSEGFGEGKIGDWPEVTSFLQKIGVSPTPQNLNAFNATTGFLAQVGITGLDLTGRAFNALLHGGSQELEEHLTGLGMDRPDARRAAQTVGQMVEYEAIKPEAKIVPIVPRETLRAREAPVTPPAEVLAATSVDDAIAAAHEAVSKPVAEPAPVPTRRGPAPVPEWALRELEAAPDDIAPEAIPEPTPAAAPGPAVTLRPLEAAPDDIEPPTAAPEMSQLPAPEQGIPGETAPGKSQLPNYPELPRITRKPSASANPEVLDRLREMGGLDLTKGDTADIGEILKDYKNPPFKRRVVNPNGLTPDEARKQLQSEGWFGRTSTQFGSQALETGAYHGDDIRDLAELIDRSARGESVYHPESDLPPAELKRRAAEDLARTTGEVHGWADKYGAKLSNDDVKGVLDRMRGGQEAHDAVVEHLERLAIQEDNRIAEEHGVAAFEPRQDSADLPFGDASARAEPEAGRQGEPGAAIENAPRDSGEPEPGVEEPTNVATFDERDMAARGGNMDAISPRERDLRDRARATEAPGDVLLSNGKFVSFADAVDAAKAAVADGMKPWPAQLGFRLDIAPRDWDRIIAALKSDEAPRFQRRFTEEPGATDAQGNALPQTVIPGAEADARAARVAAERRKLEEMRVRAQQSKIRKGGQESVADQEGGLFSSGPAQKPLFQRAPDGDGTRPADGPYFQAPGRMVVEITPEARAAREQLAARLREHLNKLNLHDVAERVVDRIIGTLDGPEDVDAYYFKKAITVALDAKDGIASLDHEVIHALRAMGLFTDAEWSILERAARDRWIKQHKIDELYDGADDATKVEEGVAFAAAKHAGDARTLEPLSIRRLFDKMRDTLRAIGNAFRGLGFDTADRVFARVQSGEVGSRPRPEMRGASGPKFVAAYHGSPHDFDEFSTDKIGTGEGAQIYGHGLYFAGRKEVAEFYRETLSRDRDRKLTNGEELPAWVANSVEAGRNIDELIDNFKGRVAEHEAEVAAQQGQYWNAKANLPGLRQIVDSLEGIKRGDVKLAPKGRLYQVDLAPKEHEYLDWDKPVAQQSAHVQAALRPLYEGRVRAIADSRDTKGIYVGPKGFDKLGPMDQLPHSKMEKIGSLPRDEVPADLAGWAAKHDVRSGEQIYHELVRDVSEEGRKGPDWTRAMRSGPADASKQLHDLGIPGIRYLDQGSRKNLRILTPEESTSGKWVVGEAPNGPNRYFDNEADARAHFAAEEARQSRNYVIFDAKNVKVEAKFQRRPPTTTEPELQLREETPGEEPLPKYAGNINLERINGPEDIKRVINEVAKARPKELDAARRGTISQRETEALAAMISPSELTRYKIGKAYNAEQSLRLRQFLVQSADDVFEKSRAARGGSDRDMLAFQEALTKHVAIQEQVAGVAAEAGRALASFKILADKGAKAEALKRMVDASGGRENIEAIAEMMSKLNSPEAVSQFAKAAYKPTSWDMITEAWINGLLSGPQTHVVNAASNLLTALMSVPESAIASGLGAFRSGERVMPREAIARLYGTVQGALDGARAAGRAFATETPSDLAGKVEGRKFQAIPSVTLREGKPKARIGGVPIPFTGEVKLGGRQIRVPGRALMASDEFFKGLAHRQELNARAARQGLSEGLKGEALAKRITDLVQNPTAAMQDAAQKYAEHQTFTDPLGTVGQSVQRIVQNMPALRFIIPFVRTPTNILKYSIERTPFAYAFKDTFRADLKGKNGAIKQDEARARIILGSSIATAVAYYAMQGMITGGGPDDPQERALWMVNHRPYSFKIPGVGWVPYGRLEPMATIMGTTADGVEISNKIGHDDAGKIAASVTGAIARNLTNKTFLSGISDAMSAFQDPERYGQSWAQQLAGSVVPSAVAQYTRAEDPYIRDARGIIDTYKSRIPGQSTTLKAKRDVFGEPIKRPSTGSVLDIVNPFIPSEPANDPVASELERLDIKIPSVPKKLGKVDLTPDEHDDLARLSGRLTKRVLAPVIASKAYQNGSDALKETLIDEALKAARDTGTGIVDAKGTDLYNRQEKRKIDAAKSLAPAR